MSAFDAAEAISRIADPLHWTDEKCALMVDACREMAFFHDEHSPETHFLYQRHGFRPQTLTREEDLARLPAVGVTAMKYFLLTSRPAEKAVLKLTSSGTR